MHPWLPYRLVLKENRDAFGAQATELHVLKTELRRRLLELSSPTLVLSVLSGSSLILAALVFLGLLE